MNNEQQVPEWWNPFDGVFFQREDDQGFGVALRLAIPAGLMLWAIFIFGVRHLVA